MQSGVPGRRTASGLPCADRSGIMAGSVPVRLGVMLMRRPTALVLLSLAAIATAADDDPEPRPARTGEAVAFDNLSSRVPASWVRQEVKTFQYARFRVPGGKDGKTD